MKHKVAKKHPLASSSLHLNDPHEGHHYRGGGGGSGGDFGEINHPTNQSSDIIGTIRASKQRKKLR